MHEVGDVAAGAAITTALLAAEHLTLWDLRGRLPLVARYTMGVAAIGAGITFTLARWGDWRGVVAFWTCAGAGGAFVAGAHIARELQEQPADRLIRRAFGG